MASTKKIRLEIEGISEVLAGLETVKKAVRRAVVKKGLRKIGAGMRKSMRARLTKGHGVEFGILKKAIAVKVGHVKGKPDALYVYVGPKTKAGKTITLPTGRTIFRLPTAIAHLVEFGTKPHRVAIKDQDGQVVNYYEHPGARARPFMRPTMDEWQGKVRPIFVQEIIDALNEAALKAIRKGKSIRGK